MPLVSAKLRTEALIEAGQRGDFAQWLEEIDAGLQQPAADLVALFSPWVEQAATLELRKARLRAKVERADIVQSVWCEFFQLPSKAQHFTTFEHLAAFLRRMATHHVERQYECHHRKRRSIDREVSLQSVLAAGEAPLAPASAGPGAAAIARETWERLLSSRPPRDQQILRLRSEGHSEREIAAALDIHERTVRKVLEKAKADFKRTQ